MNPIQFEDRISALENETTAQYEARLQANDEKQAQANAKQASGLSPEEQKVFDALLAKTKQV